MGVTTSTANAGNTMVPLFTQTLGTAAASVTFSSIPQGYTDLFVVLNHKSANTSDGSTRCVTNQTGSIYSTTFLDGNGSSASSFRDGTSAYFRPGFLTASTKGYATTIIQFMNYSNTTTYKTMLTRYSTADNEVLTAVSLMANTGAINSLTFSTDTTGFFAGSTFTIYGIQAA